MKKLTALLTLIALLMTFPNAAFATNGNSISLAHASNQYAKIVNNLGITGGAITIEEWVYPTSAPASGGVFNLAHQQNTTNFVRYFLSYQNVAGTLTLVANRQQENAANCSISGAFTLTLNTWTHVVLWYDTTNLKIYTAPVAGTHTQLATAACSGNGISGVTDNEFNVGADSPVDGTINTFDGLIDEVRVWATGVSTANLDANFQTELVGNETNLKAYYRMENNVNDTTANAFHLTAVNTPTYSTTIPFGGAAAPKFTFWQFQDF